MAMEEEAGLWDASSGESLRKMLMFLESVPELRQPVVTITPAGTFRAEWTLGSDSHFAIDFLPDGQVRFVVFCPNPRHPARVQRLAGLSDWDTVMEMVTPYDVGRWAMNAAA